MPQVRAKFKVTSKTETANNGHQIALDPVFTGSAENESFFKYTPGGRIEMSVVGEDAANAFVVGAEYYVDFTKAV